MCAVLQLRSTRPPQLRSSRVPSVRLLQNAGCTSRVRRRRQRIIFARRPRGTIIAQSVQLNIWVGLINRRPTSRCRRTFNDNMDVDRVNRVPSTLDHAPDAQGLITNEDSVQLWTRPRRVIIAVSSFTFKLPVSLRHVTGSNHIDGVTSHLPTVRGHYMVDRNLFKIRGQVIIFPSILYLRKLTMVTICW